MKIEEWIYIQSHLRKRFVHIESKLSIVYKNRETLDFDLMIEKSKENMLTPSMITC